MLYPLRYEWRGGLEDTGLGVPLRRWESANTPTGGARAVGERGSKDSWGTRVPRSSRRGLPKSWRTSSVANR